MVRTGGNDLRRLLFIIAEDRWLVSHRLHLAKTAVENDYQVAVLCRVDEQREIIESAGIELFDWKVERGSLNPFIELRSMWGIFKCIQAFKPDLVHAVALKPVFYTALIFKIKKSKPLVFALAGLGFVFSSQKSLARILRPFLIKAFRWLFSDNKVRVILQNPDDCAVLKNSNVIEEGRICLIRGAGVDTKVFSPKPVLNGVPLVILPTRLLWNKGVGDFAAVAKILKDKGVAARFALVGEPDTHNPECVPVDQLYQWEKDDVVEVWGNRNDMPEVVNKASIVCLPSSYGEGLPKVLLEAASCAKPIVTYDVPGCREIVEHGENGFLIQVKNIDSLASSLEKLINDPELCKTMGDVGREMVLKNFSQERVAGETMHVWDEVLS